MGHSNGFAAKAFLVAAREAAAMMPKGGRIVAISFAPGGRLEAATLGGDGRGKGSNGSAVRYFVGGLASRAITVNTTSPGWVEDRC